MQKDDIQKSIKDQILKIIQNFPWGSVALRLLQDAASLLLRDKSTGLYEVLENESTLELKDAKGRKAVFKKRQKVRYLQDNIIAYQDQAWGDGQILLGYQCTPGVPVDRYRFGHKTLILISLREVKRRDSIDEFHIQWGIHNGFIKDEEYWEIDVSHPTRRLKVDIIFPKSRSPDKVSVVESSQQRTWPLLADGLRCLPDGRWLISWEVFSPKQFERFVFKWTW